MRVSLRCHRSRPFTQRKIATVRFAILVTLQERHSAAGICRSSRTATAGFGIQDRTCASAATGTSVETHIHPPGRRPDDLHRTLNGSPNKREAMLGIASSHSRPLAAYCGSGEPRLCCREPDGILRDADDGALKGNGVPPSCSSSSLLRLRFERYHSP